MQKEVEQIIEFLTACNIPIDNTPSQIKILVEIGGCSPFIPIEAIWKDITNWNYNQIRDYINDSNMPSFEYNHLANEDTCVSSWAR